MDRSHQGSQNNPPTPGNRGTPPSTRRRGLRESGGFLLRRLTASPPARHRACPVRIAGLLLQADASAVMENPACGARTTPGRSLVAVAGVGRSPSHPAIDAHAVSDRLGPSRSGAAERTRAPDRQQGCQRLVGATLSRDIRGRRGPAGFPQRSLPPKGGLSAGPMPWRHPGLRPRPARAGPRSHCGIRCAA